jgi:ribosomal protein L37AE/L43A
MSEVVEGEVVGQEIEHRAQGAIAIQDELSVEQVMAQVTKIQHVMQQAMKKDEHYGTIPGTDKPTLYKPGAEKLCLTFRLAPTYPVKERTWHDNGHYTVEVTCRLTHISTGNLIAEGEGLCSTLESKYAYRNASRVCPSCGKDAIIKGKREYGGGWVCFKKKDGCGQKFSDGDPAIEGQEVGRKDNPDLADSYNTVLKMACKRALIAAVLNGTAASDIFTQDIGDTEAEVSAGSERATEGEAAATVKPSAEPTASNQAAPPITGEEAGDTPPSVSSFNPGEELRAKYGPGVLKKARDIAKANGIDQPNSLDQITPALAAVVDRELGKEVAAV